MSRVEIVIYGVYFTIKVNDKKLHIMDEITKHLTTYKFMYDRFKKKTVRTKDRTYYFYDRYKDLYRMNINLIQGVMKIIGNSGVERKDISVRHKKEVKPYHLELDIINGYKLRDYQQEYVNELVKPTVPVCKLVDMQTGGGKALWNGSLVKIKDGWCRMGDIYKGMYVTAPNGKQVKVTGVYPQGIRKLYRVKFKDGRSVLADNDHLWKVVSSNSRNKTKIITTKEISEYLDIRKNNKVTTDSRYYIELIEPEITEDKEFPVDPYVLGVILGDGCIASNNMVVVANVDDHILDMLNDRLDSDKLVAKRVNDRHISIIRAKGVTGTNALVLGLRKLKVMGLKSFQKTIPLRYLSGSVEQRYELLRGLMDTDGEVDKKESISYSTTSHKLCLSFVHLIRSLGGMCSYNTRYTYYTHNDVKKRGRLSYRMIIQMRKPRQCVTLPKRLVRLKEVNQYSETLKLRIESVTYEKDDLATCITVDSEDRLFITNDYIVTHNSFVSVFTMVLLNMRTAFLLLPKYIEKWIIELQEYTDIDEEEIYVVKGVDSLNKLIENDDGTVKVVIFSVTTMNNYIREYYKDKTGYNIAPDKIISKLKIGLVVNDEVHQHFYAVQTIMLFFNPLRGIGMSATLDSNDSGVKKIYNLIYPPKSRISNIIKYHRYIHAYSISYRLQSTRGIIYKTFQGYNHILYEQSILRNSILLEEYLNMMKYYIDTGYIKDREDSDKCLIFAASVKMCTVMKNYLKNTYEELDVRRYVEDDPYENIIEADICVSTVGSSGTGLDIPGLTTVLQTVSIGSLQANVQALGRLRHIKDREVKYLYWYCKDIYNQVKLNGTRVSVIKDKAEKIHLREYHKELKIY